MTHEPRFVDATSVPLIASVVVLLRWGMRIFTANLPLFIRNPRSGVEGKSCLQPVTLINLYPTLADPNEWTNLAGRPVFEMITIQQEFRIRR